MQTTWRFAKSCSNYVKNASFGCGSWKCGALLLRMRHSASNAASGEPDRRSAAVSSRVERLHTSFISQREGDKPESTLFWFVLIHRSQTDLFILFTPWPTKRRKLTRNSRVGKILSTTHGRGNSSGAPRAVGVSNRFFFFDKCQLHALKTCMFRHQKCKTTCGLGMCFVAR